MPLSRRQFFRRVVNSKERTASEREARRAALESYVRAYLLPYDFALTGEQYSELVDTVRKRLEEMSDTDLFSPHIHSILADITESKVQPWRDAAGA